MHTDITVLGTIRNFKRNNNYYNVYLCLGAVTTLRLLVVAASDPHVGLPSQLLFCWTPPIYYFSVSHLTPSKSLHCQLHF
jgi:hypothetical protein